MIIYNYLLFLYNCLLLIINYNNYLFIYITHLLIIILSLSYVQQLITLKTLKTLVELEPLTLTLKTKTQL